MKYQNVLIIDDDQDDREIFLEAIKDVSSLINCTTFHDGELALGQLMEKAIAPDAIFLDLNMPRMTGMEFLERARKTDALKTTPIIIYSTSSYIEASRSQLEEASGYICKPDNYPDLVAILKELILTPA